MLSYQGRIVGRPLVWQITQFGSTDEEVMRMAQFTKRIFLMVVVNFLVMITITVVLGLLRVGRFFPAGRCLPASPRRGESRSRAVHRPAGRWYHRGAR